MCSSDLEIPGITGNTINEPFCEATKLVFNNTDSWDEHGGFTSMTAAMNAGMVLVLSLWDDYYADMLWLDSDYPTTGDPSEPGIARGTCPTTSGVPATVEADDPGAYVIYSNIKVGPINSTFTYTSVLGGSGTTGTSTTSSATTTSTGTAGEYAQCGGIGYTGPTVCVSPYTCEYSNPYYSQCL